MKKIDVNRIVAPDVATSPSPSSPKATNRHAYDNNFRREMVLHAFSIIRQYPWIINNISEIARRVQVKVPEYKKHYLEKWTEGVLGVDYVEEMNKIQAAYLLEFGGKSSLSKPPNEKTSSAKKGVKKKRIKKEVHFSDPEAAEEVRKKKDYGDEASLDEISLKEQQELLEKRMAAFFDDEELPKDTSTEELRRLKESSPEFGERLKEAILGKGYEGYSQLCGRK